MSKVRKREERQRIRDLFLNPRKTYSPEDTAQLVDTDLGVLMGRIKRGHLEAQTVYLLDRRDVLQLALDRYSLEEIFAALGRDADRALPPLLRPKELRTMLPAYIVRVITHVSKQNGVSTGEVIQQALHDYVAEERSNDLGMDDEIPGLREALFYPERQGK